MLKRWLNHIRGGICLFVVALLLIIGDPVQRLIFTLFHLSGRPTERLKAFWFRLWANIMLLAPRILCGARFKPLPAVPGDSGILILMNHQSLLDIPYLGAMLNKNYPLFVTRRRYATGVPLVSHMLRTYKFPLVDSARFSASQSRALAHVAASATVPLAVFPEGTRTRNGEIRSFKTAGINAILCSRPWSVYVVVADGLWMCATLTDFVEKISQITPKSAVFGPFSFDPRADDPESFMVEMREKMVCGLYRLRQEPVH